MLCPVCGDGRVRAYYLEQDSNSWERGEDDELDYLSENDLHCLRSVLFFDDIFLDICQKCETVFT